ncbi:MAG: MTH938/NDUFAF3 family protein, partial [Myxococcota bacterium]
WGLHGTRHTPGVGIDEVEDLVARGAAAIVLSRGREGHLQVPAATVAHLRERGVEVDVLWTDQAIDRYNERAARGERVAALIHSTC